MINLTLNYEDFSTDIVNFRSRYFHNDDPKCWQEKVDYDSEHLVLRKCNEIVAVSRMSPGKLVDFSTETHDHYQPIKTTSLFISRTCIIEPNRRLSIAYYSLLMVSFQLTSKSRGKGLCGLSTRDAIGALNSLLWRRAGNEFMQHLCGIPAPVTPMEWSPSNSAQIGKRIASINRILHNQGLIWDSGISLV